MTNKSILYDQADRALFVIDMTAECSVDSPSSGPMASLIRMIAGEIEYFRRKGRPVFFFISELCEKGSSAVEKKVISALSPRSNEKVLYKPSFSCFYNTQLETDLSALRVKKITLTGIQTHTSILCTAIDALSRGLHVATPQTCVYSHDHRKHELALKLIREDFFPPLLDLDSETIAS